MGPKGENCGIQGRFQHAAGAAGRTHPSNSYWVRSVHDCHCPDTTGFVGLDFLCLHLPDSTLGQERMRCLSAAKHQKDTDTPTATSTSQISHP